MDNDDDKISNLYSDANSTRIYTNVTSNSTIGNNVTEDSSTQNNDQDEYYDEDEYYPYNSKDGPWYYDEDGEYIGYYSGVYQE